MLCVLLVVECKATREIGHWFKLGQTKPFQYIKLLRREQLQWRFLSFTHVVLSNEMNDVHISQLFGSVSVKLAIVYTCVIHSNFVNVSFVTL